MERSGSSWLLMTVGATALWGLWGLMIKSALTDINWQMLATISLAGYLIPLIGVWTVTRPTEGIGGIHHVPRAVFLGLIAQLAVFCFYIGIDLGKASVVVPLTALYPAITLLGSVSVLKERINRVQVLGVGIALVAAVLLGLG